MHRFPFRPFASMAFLLWMTGCSAVWPGGPDTLAMAQEVLATKVALADAVPIAIQRAGGVAAEVHFKNVGNAFVYEVKVITPHETNFVSIDASTGVVIHENRNWAQVRWLRQRDQSERRALAKTSAMTLRRAVETAERQSGGRAFEVRVNSRKSPEYYIVKVAKDNALSIVNVNVE